MSSLEFISAVSVDKGKIRNNNEDNFYLNGKNLLPQNREESRTYDNKAYSSELPHIYAVFDGMGGEEAGEEASIIVAETLKKIHKSIKNDKKYDVKSLIVRTVEIANAEICNRMLEDNISRMGTTFAAITIDSGKITAYNLGDSRIYMMRNGKLKQISVDDTVVQRMIDSGIIKKEDARFHIERHVITQHLGIFPDELKLEIHISNEILYKKGDCFLICSDGLTDMVSDENICRILLQKKSCSKLSQELVQEALNNGGKDNVTAMVIISEMDSKENNMKTKMNSRLPKKITPRINHRLSITKKCIVFCLASLLFLCTSIGIVFNHKSEKVNNENVITNLEWSTGENIIDNIISKDANENGEFYCKVGFDIENQSEDFVCSVYYESSNPEILDIDSMTGKLSVGDTGVATLTATVGESESIEKEVVVFDVDMETESLNMRVSDTKGIDYRIILPDNCPESISDEYIRQHSIYTVSDEESNCICINDDKTITSYESGEIEVIVSIEGYKAVVPVNAFEMKEKTRRF